MDRIDRTIFREYDIRGIVDTQLQDSVVERIAAAFAAVLVRSGKDSAVVGMDGRPSSPRFKTIVNRTLAAYGIHVTDIGLVPTPVMYYTLFKRGLGGGIMITASHNPPEYNGFKAMVGHDTLSGDQIRELFDLAEREDFAPRKPGSIQAVSMNQTYLEEIAASLDMQKKLKVVIDCGNGTAGITAMPLYEKIGIEVIGLFTEVDGSFPNHHPDPTRAENLRDLITAVRQHGADLGIGFDGDADRIGVVDGRGRILWGDQLLVLLARDVLGRHPGRTVISEVKASEVLYEEIRRAGGKPVMWKAGHSLIKKKIFEENAVLAGEVSGHIFFNDHWYGFDDGVYTGARLLEILSRSEQSLAELLDTIPSRVNTPEQYVEIPEEIKFAVVEQVVETFRKRYEVIDIDGARVKFPFGWALVRASNTQPALVIRFEADSEANLESMRAEVLGELERIRARF
ncbi:MAG: phosphomannomutase/phosphoglucomutase [Acidobacteriota bacterium]|jgi:phosphomannomutase/phosphoglucomutase|nr:phosphomannomutase/phosphoglucomutase [Acidobacteriota bacterium]